MAAKQFAKAYKEFRVQAAIELAFLPALPEPFTRAALAEMRNHLDPVLVRNSDPEAVAQGFFTPLYVLLSDPLHWDTAGLMWLHLHQLTFFTISNPVRAAEFLRYAESRHKRLFPANNNDMMALASSMMGAGDNPLAGLASLGSVKDLKDIDIEKLLGGFPGLSDVAKTVTETISAVTAGNLDEAAVRAKIHETYEVVRAHPIIGGVFPPEDALLQAATCLFKKSDADAEAMDLD